MFSRDQMSDRTTRFIEATIGDEHVHVQARMRARGIRLHLDPAASERFTGQMIVFMLLNLLLRLDIYCPPITVALPRADVHPLLRLLQPGNLRAALHTFFQSFPAAARLSFQDASRGTRSTDLDIVVGPVTVPGALTVWADGWIVYLNADAPSQLAGDNSVGASVAAGLGAAEIFKRLINELPLRSGLTVVPAERLVFSTYDYRLAAGDNPPLPSAIDVDNTVIVGLGGIGVALVAAVASLPRLAGKLTLVDGDTIDATSQNRFLIARPGATGFKVDLCRQALAFHPDVDPCAEWFNTFTDHCGDRHELVVVGVDKDQVRRDIQASRPRLILNAGTSDTASFRLTLHDYLHGACLACISRSDLQDHPVECELAHTLGLDLETVLHYRATQQPIPRTLLERSGTLDEAVLQHLGNRPLAEIQQRLCGQVVVGATPEAPAISISFLSALPGFLLLGELIKERAYPTMPRPPLNGVVNHAMFSVFGRLHPTLLHSWRNKRVDCDCARGAYQRAFARKWPATTA